MYIVLSFFQLSIMLKLLVILAIISTSLADATVSPPLKRLNNTLRALHMPNSSSKDVDNFVVTSTMNNENNCYLVQSKGFYRFATTQ